MKNMKKAVSVALSAVMVMGMAVPAMADDTTSQGGNVTAPIYSFDVVDVIVPSTYAVAFNPGGLTVKTGDSDTSNAQILSKSFGIVNKSSKDKVITATLTVEDQNATNGVTFVNSAQEVTDAKDGEYKIHLTAVPADATEVKIGNASANETTAATALSDVVMTGATGKAVTLKAGVNKIGFKLDKATYTAKSSNPVTLGTSNQNNVKDNYEVTGLATGGKGITAFSFGGEMNAKADWSKLTNGIKITAVYTNETAPSDATVITGTGAMVALTAAPTFASNNVGEITYTAGSGDDALASIISITMDSFGTAYDGMAELSGAWGAATDSNGTITFDINYISAFARDFPDDTTKEATITYKTAKNEEKTAIVELKLR